MFRAWNFGYSNERWEDRAQDNKKEIEADNIVAARDFPVEEPFVENEIDTVVDVFLDTVIRVHDS